MALTAFLPTGALQVLPFIGSPGAGTVGHALVWSQVPQGFNLAPISVGPDQFTGVLPVSREGQAAVRALLRGLESWRFRREELVKISY